MRPARCAPWFAVAILPLLAGGCAYSFNPSALPSHVKTLQIPTLGNQTLEPTLSQELTDALTQRFISDNTLQVIAKDADAVLEGEIVEYQNRVFGIGSDSVADQYLVLIKVKMRLRDRVKNRDLWSEEAMEGRASYGVGGEQAGQTVASEEEARNVAIRQVVDAAISLTVEGW